MPSNQESIDLPEKYFLSQPYLLNIPFLEYFLQERFSFLLKERLDFASGESIDITIKSPETEEARFCIQTNQTLKATLEIRWTGSDEVIHLAFPYPVHGVFILRSESNRDWHAGKWAWHPRLVGRPGLWLLRKYTFKRGERIETDYIRFIFASGRHLDYTLNAKKNRLSLPGFALTPLSFGETLHGNCGGYKEIKQLFSSWYFRIGPKEKGQFAEGYSAAMGKIAERITSDKYKPLDEHDVNWQRLYTYNAFLAERIIEFFARGFEMLKAEKTPSRFWSGLCNISQKMEQGAGLVDTSALIRSGRLHYFDPLNGIDALSRLTSFQRYNFPKSSIEQLPARFRQNHPSHRGLICPVETPESKKVGITLHLARRVRTDILGRLYPSEEEADDKDLGYAASLVPFYEHNDGPRSMMGAKNLKQAVPIKGTEQAAIRTGHERLVNELTEPTEEYRHPSR